MSEPVLIYTDGSSRGNPGPGGYGIILKYGRHERELSKGFRHTTNNRMELLAVIEGLKALKKKRDFRDCLLRQSVCGKGYQGRLAKKMDSNQL